MTLISSATSLCPVAEFLKRVDRLAVAKLASDDTTGKPVPDSSLATDPNVAAALLDATGMFETAVMMGGKYAPADLALLFSTPCGSQGLMFRIISDIAWIGLFKRRPNMNVEVPPTVKESLQWLDMLAMGKRIFGFQETQDATVMEKSDATSSDVWQRNSSVDQSVAYWGRRSDMTDILGGGGGIWSW